MRSDSGPKLRLLVRHSAAAKDIALAEELLSYLRPLERIAGLDVWTEARILPGDETWTEIQRAIEQADVALPLLSADFFASAELVEREMPCLLERRRAGQLRIVPVLLRSCLWDIYPWLKELDPLPKDREPIASRQGAARDRALTELAKEIAGLATPTGSTITKAGNDKVQANDPPGRGGDVYNINFNNSVVGSFGAGQGVTVSGTATVNSNPTQAAVQEKARRSSGLPIQLKNARLSPVLNGTELIELLAGCQEASKRVEAEQPGMTDTAKASVYLSYGDDDLPSARPIYEALEAAGVFVFFRHEHAVPGTKHHRQARSCLREYEHVVLVCSERSLLAANVLHELNELLLPPQAGGSRRLVTVVLDNFCYVDWNPRDIQIRLDVLAAEGINLSGVDQEASRFQKGIQALLVLLNG